MPFEKHPLFIIIFDHALIKTVLGTTLSRIFTIRKLRYKCKSYSIDLWKRINGWKTCTWNRKFQSTDVNVLVNFQFFTLCCASFIGETDRMLTSTSIRMLELVRMKIFTGHNELGCWALSTTLNWGFLREKCFEFLWWIL